MEDTFPYSAVGFCELSGDSQRARVRSVQFGKMLCLVLRRVPFSETQDLVGLGKILLTAVSQISRASGRKPAAADEKLAPKSSLQGQSSSTGNVNNTKWSEFSEGGRGHYEVQRTHPRKVR